MGMSTHIQGFRPPDTEWKAMKEVYDSCVKADIEIPSAVDNFFEGEKPSGLGVSVRIDDTEAVKPYQAESCDGYEIEISKLPKDLRYIRVYNSY